MPATLDQRAELAKRAEDRRIAFRHYVEAAARPATPENVAAWRRASNWLDVCTTREQHARGVVIRANHDD